MIEKIFQTLHIAAEAKRVILIAFLVCVLLCWAFPAQYLFVILIFIFFLPLFRDPIRDIPDDPAAVVSPGDGTITDINIVAVPELGEQPFRCIGIFLSIFNVHVQRFPYPGEIERIKYTEGKFYPAFRKEARGKNESNTVVIKTDRGTMAVKQIAGLVARRIVCNVPPKKKIAKGERLGIIMFGSRVELYIPTEIELLVKVGDKVIGGETTIGTVK